ncbi:MAG: hypothetical protein AAFX52_01195 [Pseudomonadota bacterium]
MVMRVKKRPTTFGDHVTQIGKYLSWLAYALVALILVLFGGIHIIAGFFPDSAAAQYILPEIFRNALDQAEGADPGQRGDYFNFLIGVPLAAAGSAVAAVVAASAKSVANRQRIIQEMDLADKKLSDGSGEFLRLVNAFDDLYEQGIAFQRAVNELREITRKERIHILATLRDDIYDDPQQQTKGPRVEELRAIYKPLISRHLDFIAEKCAIVFEVYQRLTFDPFWSRAIDFQGEGYEAGWTRLEERMRKELGMSAMVYSPRAIARQLRRWTNDFEPETAILAIYYLPDDATAIDFVGAVINLTTKSGDVPRYAALKQWEDKDETTLEIYNRGAASLFTLFRAMPSQEALRNTVFNFFPNLNSFESRAYFDSLPNKRRITHDDLLEIIDDTFNAPGSLIYLQGMTTKTIYEWPNRLETRASEDKNKGRSRPKKKGVVDVFRRNRLSANDLATGFDGHVGQGRPHLDALMRPVPEMKHNPAASDIKTRRLH